MAAKEDIPVRYREALKKSQSLSKRLADTLSGDPSIIPAWELIELLETSMKEIAFLRCEWWACLNQAIDRLDTINQLYFEQHSGECWEGELDHYGVWRPFALEDICDDCKERLEKVWG